MMKTEIIASSHDPVIPDSATVPGFCRSRLWRQRQVGDAQAQIADAAGLRQDGVGLAIHLLQQEIQLLADLAAGVQQLVQLAASGSSGARALR